MSIRNLVSPILIIAAAAAFLAGSTALAAVLIVAAGAALAFTLPRKGDPRRAAIEGALPGCAPV